MKRLLAFVEALDYFIKNDTNGLGVSCSAGVFYLCGVVTKHYVVSQYNFEVIRTKISARTEIYGIPLSDRQQYFLVFGNGDVVEQARGCLLVYNFFAGHCSDLRN